MVEVIVFAEGQSEEQFIKDPILPAEIVGGFQVRERVAKAQARRAARRNRVCS